MTCKQCGYQFCARCRNTWNPDHDFESCKRFEPVPILYDQRREINYVLTESKIDAIKLSVKKYEDNKEILKIRQQLLEICDIEELDSKDIHLYINELIKI